MNFMERAVLLSRKALGHTSPNPPVGALIVKDGMIVGEGWTQSPGPEGWHAEREAIVKAGKKSSGGVLYTTLEPCNHQGRTPPCTEEIIKSGIKEVHVSLLDPNPEVNGNGVDRLKLAGIKVLIGEGKEQSGEILATYLKFVTKGMPFVTVKYAMTLDGKIATYTGDSQWISGTKSRQYVHKLRSENDVILTGIGTVLADNPRLSVRDKSIPTYDFKQPLRVVVDSKGQIPLDSAVFSEHGETLLAVTERFAPSTKSKFRGKEIDVESIPEDEDGRVDLKILLDRLSGNLGMITVLVESGPKLLGTFFDSGLVDKVEVFIAPKIIGGENAFSAVAGKGIEYLSDVMKLENIQVVTIGEDVLIKAYSHGVLSDCYK